MTISKTTTPGQDLTWYRTQAMHILPLHIIQRFVQDFNQGARRLCDPVLVSLTAAGQTTLWTPQDGYVDFVTHWFIKGQTALSGGTAAVLKIGLASESYGSLNGTTGHTLTTGTASSWPDVGKIMDLSSAYPSNCTLEFTDAAAVVADVSGGAPPTTGAIYVIPFGVRIPENLL